MIYGIRLRAYPKKPFYKNKYISAKVDVYNGTEFKYEILKDNKYCKYKPTEPKKWQSLRIFFYNITRFYSC